MVCSMTAFARREAEGEWGRLTWELRSVNHRYLEMTVRLPEELRALEPAVRERVGAALGRGKVECQLRFRPDPGAVPEVRVNSAYADRLVTALEEIAGRLPAPGPVSPLEVLRWPGVVEQTEPDDGPVREAALAALDGALGELTATRQREGARIGELIEARCAQARTLVEAVRARRPEVLEQLRAKLRERLGELDAVTPDPGRLEQELVYQAQRLDVDEELDRLGAHLDEIASVLDGGEAAGRRLNFLMQELNREANTLGSKAADAATTRASVDLKVLIEQMREQVQNLE